MSNYAGLVALAHSANGLAQFGITTQMMERQIDAESGGNPWAIGPPTKYGCALGLVQFIPATCRELRLEAPFNAEQAIQAQGRYLAMCASVVAPLVRPNVPANVARWVFASYNWGMGNVKGRLEKLLKSGTPAPFPATPSILAGVPRETIQYVGRIVG